MLHRSDRPRHDPFPSVANDGFLEVKLPLDFATQ